MRKLTAILLALMLICAAALAENAENLMALDFEHFTIAVPKDAVGSGTDTIENNVPFLTIYQDYDPNAFMGRNLSIVWNEEVLDITGLDAAGYARAVAGLTLQEYEAVGIVVNDARMYSAEMGELDERPVISYVFSMSLDFSSLGMNRQETMYTLQAVAPIEGAGTYTFTISTNDLENSQMLIDIVDSVRWKG